MSDFVYGIDVSSYQGHDLSGLIALERPSHVVVRMYLPGESPSQQVSIDQVNTARAAGCTIGAYVWAYSTFDARKSVADALAVAKQCGMDPPPVLWIDCETYTDAAGRLQDRGPDVAWLVEAVDECAKRNVQAGIYTGGWWWKGYLGDSKDFLHLPLWAAQYYDHVANPTAVDLFGGWKFASGKQWGANGVDRDVFLQEFTDSQPIPIIRTLDDLEAANPNLRDQLRIWQKDQVVKGLDPLNYGGFQQFQIDIGAPDPGADEFIGFRRPMLEDLQASNPNIASQLVDWQHLQSRQNLDPLDYGEFRKFQIIIFAPDPGPTEFIGFLRPTIGDLEQMNPNIRSQLNTWRKIRTDRNQDQLDYAAFRQFEIDLGAPDPTPWECEGFRQSESA